MTTQSAHAVAAIPQRGERLPGFSGTTPSGNAIRLRDYYLRRNLALVFTHSSVCGACRALLAGLAERRSEIQAEAGEVLAVIPRTAQDVPDLPFPIMLDDDNAVHRRYGLVDATGHPRAAIFLVDRYGVVFEASVAAADHAMLSAGEVPNWLEFIACRCS